MGLSIRFLDGPRTDEVVAVGDDVPLVVVGRDAAVCHVAFPDEENRVGRQHCAIRRVLSRYRLVLDRDHLVLVDGKPAYDEQELDPVAQLRLGPGGPRIEVITESAANVQRTMFQGARRPTAGVLIESAEQHARAGRKIALAAIGIVLVVAALGWWAVTRTEGKVASLEERQSARVEELRSKVSGLEEQLARVEPRMKQGLTRALESTYLVVIEDAEGRALPQATAWVVAPGVLATNAHVAEMHDALEEGTRMLVRSSGSPVRDHVIARVELHAGYARFQEVWAAHEPFRPALGGYERLVPVAACDVALLHVEDATGLAAPLEVATSEEMRALSHGDDVGMVGFPMETMALGGVNAAHPTPTVQVGNVTAVTDFFLQKDLSGENHLVQHSLPIAGGASGSPMLARSGKVVGVISAANVVIREDTRIFTGVGVNFAQRADLVKELLDGRAEAATGPRGARWETDIRQFFSMQQVFAEDVEKVTANLVDQWSTTLGAEAEAVDEQEATLAPDANGRFAATLSVDVPRAGPYLLLAVPKESIDIDLYVFRTETDGGAVVGKDEEPDWYPVVQFTADGSVTLSGTIIGPRDALPVRLLLFGQK